MDAIDRQLVELLRANGRLSQEQLARQVNLSRPAIHERIKRLEAQGVIRGYAAIVDWEAWGQPLAAFIWVRTVGAKCRASALALMALTDREATIDACHRVTGDWCMLLQVHAVSSRALEGLIDRIRDVPGVAATMTVIALSTLDSVTVQTTDSDDVAGAS